MFADMKNSCIFASRFTTTQFNHNQNFNLMQNSNLNQSKPIFWKNKECKLVKWETLTLGGELKVKLNRKLVTVNLSELRN